MGLTPNSPFPRISHVDFESEKLGIPLGPLQFLCSIPEIVDKKAQTWWQMWNGLPPPAPHLPVSRSYYCTTASFVNTQLEDIGTSTEFIIQRIYYIQF